MAGRIIVAVILLGFPACSLALGSPKVIAGRWFSETDLVLIQRGTPVTELYRIGGAPLETLESGDGERWRYSMSVERTEHVKFMEIVPLPSRRSVRTFEIVFEIRNGLVSDVTSNDSCSLR
jgi:hypothetical protein